MTLMPLRTCCSSMGDHLAVSNAWMVFKTLYTTEVGHSTIWDCQFDVTVNHMSKADVLYRCPLQIIMC